MRPFSNRLSARLGGGDVTRTMYGYYLSTEGVTQMSTALTDLLIAIADPVELIRYHENPENYMTERSLSEEDKAVLRSRDLRKIRWQANSAGFDERRNLFIQFKEGHNPETYVIYHLHVEIHLDNVQHDLVAIRSGSVVFADENGNLLLGRPRAVGKGAPNG